MTYFRVPGPLKTQNKKRAWGRGYMYVTLKFPSLCLPCHSAKTESNLTHSNIVAYSTGSAKQPLINHFKLYTSPLARRVIVEPPSRPYFSDEIMEKAVLLLAAMISLLCLWCSSVDAVEVFYVKPTTNH